MKKNEKNIIYKNPFINNVILTKKKIISCRPLQVTSFCILLLLFIHLLVNPRMGCIEGGGTRLKKKTDVGCLRQRKGEAGQQRKGKEKGKRDAAAWSRAEQRKRGGTQTFF